MKFLLFNYKILSAAFAVDHFSKKNLYIKILIVIAYQLGPTLSRKEIKTPSTSLY